MVTPMYVHQHECCILVISENVKKHYQGIMYVFIGVWNAATTYSLELASLA